MLFKQTWKGVCRVFFRLLSVMPFAANRSYKGVPQRNEVKAERDALDDVMLRGSEGRATLDSVIDAHEQDLRVLREALLRKLASQGVALPEDPRDWRERQRGR